MLYLYACFCNVTFLHSRNCDLLLLPPPVWLWTADAARWPPPPSLVRPQHPIFAAATVSLPFPRLSLPVAFPLSNL